MLKINKKTLSIMAVCILAIALVTAIATTSAASTSGTDLSVLNIVKDIQSKLNALFAKESANVQVVTYSGSFVLTKGDLLSGTYRIALVDVNGPEGTRYDGVADWSKAADFKVSLRAYMTDSENPSDTLTSDTDFLGIYGGLGDPQIGSTVFLDAEDKITNGRIEESFTGNSIEIALQIGSLTDPSSGVVNFDTTIHYSYTVTTSADATVTQQHFSSPNIMV